MRYGNDRYIDVWRFMVLRNHRSNNLLGGGGDGYAGYWRTGTRPAAGNFIRELCSTPWRQAAAGGTLSSRPSSRGFIHSHKLLFFSGVSRNRKQGRNSAPSRLPVSRPVRCAVSRPRCLTRWDCCGSGNYSETYLRVQRSNGI